VLRFVGCLPEVDVAAISAHYSSVSAITFIAASNYLRFLHVPFPDYASAFLAVMEAPAILVGVVLGKMAAKGRGSLGPVIRRAVHEAITGRSVLLLVGALVAGWASGKKGDESTAGFFVTPFQGVLALFLLEMGMVAARWPLPARLRNCRARAQRTFWGMAGQKVGLGTGGTILIATLAASTSYIGAPAAMRLSLPEANLTPYPTSALAITFPFNITLGRPLYLEVVRRLGDSAP